MSGLFYFLRYVLAGLLIWLAYKGLRRWFLATTQRTEKNKGPAGTALVQCETCRDYLPKEAPRCQRQGCPRALVVLGLMLTFIAGTAQAEGGGRYLFELTGENVQATLEVNGLIAAQWTLQTRDTVGASFNHWLKSGNNSLRIRFKPLSGRASPLVTGRAYFLALANGQQTNLLSFLDPQTYKPEQSISFKLANAPKLALWHTHAPPNTQGILDAFYASWDQSVKVISEGKSLSQAPLVSAEFSDYAVAYGAAAATHPIAIRPGSGQITKVSGKPAANDLSFEPVAGTTFYRLARKDGDLLLSIKAAQGDVMAQALLVGFTEQGWRILRRTY
jgi:hypothetical protein